jgi:hypothetical protein
MSDIVNQFRASLPSMSDQDKQDALNVIEEQIKAIMQSVQEAVKQVEGALTRGYREAWNARIEMLRMDVTALEQVMQLLKK